MKRAVNRLLVGTLVVLVCALVLMVAVGMRPEHLNTNPLRLLPTQDPTAVMVYCIQTAKTPAALATCRGENPDLFDNLIHVYGP